MAALFLPCLYSSALFVELEQESVLRGKKRDLVKKVQHLRDFKQRSLCLFPSVRGKWDYVQSSTEKISK